MSVAPAGATTVPLRSRSPVAGRRYPTLQAIPQRVPHARDGRVANQVGPLARIVHEVDALGLNGPSGGSIAAMGVREVLGGVSTFVPRDLIRPSITVGPSAPDRPAPRAHGHPHAQVDQRHVTGITVPC